MNQHDFMIALVVFLVAAVVAVPLARRFGLGAVLGYLLAGAAIGPYALRLVTNVESILHFSEFGVVLMMFVIGLELEPRKLKNLRKTIFGYGTAQMAACALVVGERPHCWARRGRLRSSPVWASRCRLPPLPLLPWPSGI